MFDKFGEVVTKLRKCGFFADYQHLTDKELVKQLIREGRANDEYGEFEGILKNTDNDLFFSMRVASLDRTRVWWQDLECDVCRVNEVYKDVVRDFSQLSADYFTPKNIQEHWPTEVGPAIVTFEENGRENRYEAEYYNDWLDARIIFSFITQIMKDNGSPYDFYIHEESGQDIFTVRATPEEKAKLGEELGWVLNKQNSD